MTKLLKSGSVLLALFAVAMFSTTGLCAAQTASNAAPTTSVVTPTNGVTPQEAAKIIIKKYPELKSKQAALVDFFTRLASLIGNESGFIPYNNDQLIALINNFKSIDWNSGILTPNDKTNLDAAIASIMIVAVNPGQLGFKNLDQINPMLNDIVTIFNIKMDKKFAAVFAQIQTVISKFAQGKLPVKYFNDPIQARGALHTAAWSKIVTYSLMMVIDRKECFIITKGILKGKSADKQIIHNLNKVTLALQGEQSNAVESGLTIIKFPAGPWITGMVQASMETGLIPKAANSVVADIHAALVMFLGAEPEPEVVGTTVASQAI